jgi:hypothetical protein
MNTMHVCIITMDFIWWRSFTTMDTMHVCIIMNTIWWGSFTLPGTKVPSFT